MIVGCGHFATSGKPPATSIAEVWLILLSFPIVSVKLPTLNLRRTRPVRALICAISAMESLPLLSLRDARNPGRTESMTLSLVSSWACCRWSASSLRRCSSLLALLRSVMKDIAPYVLRSNDCTITMVLFDMYVVARTYGWQSSETLGARRIQKSGVRPRDDEGTPYINLSAPSPSHFLSPNFTTTRSSRKEAEATCPQTPSHSCQRSHCAA